MTKIMVTGAGSLLGQGILRSVWRRSRSINMGSWWSVAVDPNPETAVGCQWANVSHAVPMASDETYLDAIKETIDHERPDIVMIGTDEELPIFADNREELEAEFGTRILVSHPYVVGIANDKWLTYEWMKERGFNPPGTRRIGDDYFVRRPVVVKPRIGGRSRGMRIIRDGPFEMFDGELEQEFIDGPEYTAGAICFGGEVATIVMRRELKDGNTYRAYVEEFPELNAKVREWTLALNPYGPVNFQFRVDGNGEPRCFEINARFSGTTPFRLLAGFNEVEMCVRHLLYNEPIKQPQIEPMTILRYWNELAVRK